MPTVPVYLLFSEYCHLLRVAKQHRFGGLDISKWTDDQIVSREVADRMVAARIRETDEKAA